MYGSVVVKKQLGFTLVELMIVVVVLGILSMVAIPAYNDNVMKGRRADAKSTLTTAASRMEQYFMDNKSYTTDMTKLGYGSPAASTDGYYVLSAAACGGGSIATCYVLTATPGTGSPQKDDSKCPSLTLNYMGTRAPTSCW